MAYVYGVAWVICGNDPQPDELVMNPGPEWGWSVDVSPASAVVSQEVASL